MQPIVAPDEPAPPPVDTPAGAVLRPALMLWLVTQLVYGAMSQLWAFTWEDDRPAGIVLGVSFAGLLAVYGLIAHFVWRDPEARRILARPRPRMVELCVVVGVGASLLLATWEFRIPSGWSTSSGFELEHLAGIPWWGALLTGALLPALFEEWMFRGLLLDRFRRVLAPGFAVAMQAMLFSVWHFDPVMVMPHFVFGVVAGVLRVAAGGLWPCMLMHLLWNGYVVLLVYDLL